MPDYQPKVKDVLNFVFSHRQNKVFRGLEKDVTLKICNAITDEELYYTSSGDKLTGIILIKHFPKEKVVYVREILCITKESLLQFLEAFNQLFPEHTLEASRDEQLVSYSKTNRLCHLLKKI